MIITYTLHDVQFGWDREKAASNLDKHGVSFESACEAFFDPEVFRIISARRATRFERNRYEEC